MLLPLSRIDAILENLWSGMNTIGNSGWVRIQNGVGGCLILRSIFVSSRELNWQYPSDHRGDTVKATIIKSDYALTEEYVSSCSRQHLVA